MTAFGTAVDSTGADEFLAKWIVWALKPFGVMTVFGRVLCFNDSADATDVPTPPLHWSFCGSIGGGKSPGP